MTYIIIAIAITFFLLWRSRKSTRRLPYTCIRHIDGDTSEYRDDRGNRYTVRYEFMDADESNHPFGSHATKKLNQLVPVGSRVSLEFNGVDRYGRHIATVKTDRLNVNYEMVVNGFAVSETSYKGDPSVKQQYIAAEKYAESHELGRWSRPEWCAMRPSGFRRMQRAKKSGSDKKPIKRKR